MEIKRNQATRNRPKGDRILDAPFVVIDLHQSAHQLREEKAWLKNDKNGMTIFKSSGLAAVLVILKEGTEMNNTITDSYLSIQVISGDIRISMPGDETEIREDQLIVLHPKVEHSILALSESVILLTNTSE